MPWCFLGSHEIADWAQMVLPPRESSYICRTCADTERGKRLMQPVDYSEGYRNARAERPGKWSRIYKAMMRPGYLKKTYER